MSDLIERSKAIQAIYWNVMECNNIEMAESVLKDVPSVDTVKHGHWLPHPNPEYREWDVCSSCGTGCKRREYHVDFMTKMEWERQINYPYCPNCGAKMDEKTTD